MHSITHCRSLREKINKCRQRHIVTEYSSYVHWTMCYWEITHNSAILEIQQFFNRTSISFGAKLYFVSESREFRWNLQLSQAFLSGILFFIIPWFKRLNYCLFFCSSYLWCTRFTSSGTDLPFCLIKICMCMYFKNSESDLVAIRVTLRLLLTNEHQT